VFKKIQFSFTTVITTRCHYSSGYKQEEEQQKTSKNIQCTLDYVGNGKEGEAWIVQDYG
jgi:hypothetical protein